MEEMKEKQVSKKELFNKILGKMSFFPWGETEDLFKVNFISFTYLISFMAEAKVFDSEFIKKFLDEAEERQKKIRETFDKVSTDAEQEFCRDIYLIFDQTCTNLLSEMQERLERPE